MDKLHLHIYNNYHLGDCIFSIILLNKIIKSIKRNDVYIHFFCKKEYFYQLNEFIDNPYIFLLNIRLIHKIQSQKKIHLLSIWIGDSSYKNNYFNYVDKLKKKEISYNNILVLYYNEFIEKINYLFNNIFHINIKVENINDIKYNDIDILNRYNSLIKKYNKYEDLDYLFINCYPMSGQYIYNKSLWDEKIIRLSKTHKVATILKVNGVLCTADDKLTVKDIAAISTHTKILVAINSGPFVACLNEFTLNYCSKIIVFGNDGAQYYSYNNFFIGQNINDI